MKIALKVFLGLAILILVIFSVWFLYKNSILNNLKNKETLANDRWQEVCKKINSRNLMLYEAVFRFKTLAATSNKQYLADLPKISQVAPDLLLNCDKGFTSNFIEQQYELNKEYLQVLNIYRKDSIFQKDTSFILFIKIEKHDSVTNELVKDYNNLVVDYNEYYSVFPNFFIAKSKGLVRKPLFQISYGIDNKDPVLKNKELPKWAIGVDTL